MKNNIVADYESKSILGHTVPNIIMSIKINTTKCLDYLEFYEVFGDNKKLYETLKPIKQSGKITWKEIKELKYGNIDLESNIITIKK